MQETTFVLDEYLQSLELDSTDTMIFSMLSEAGNPGRSSALCAIKHLAKAKRLIGVDDEMAAFRAFTAEEEAATALIHTLKRHQYQGSKKLNHWKHAHKAAVWPLLRALESQFASLKNITPVLEIEWGPKRRRLQLRLEISGVRIALSDPPLDFKVNCPDGTPLNLFREVFSRMAANSGAKTIQDHINDRANMRNRVLYGTPEGVPAVCLNQGFIDDYKRRLKYMLAAFLLVDQNPQKQPFAQYCLDALLTSLPQSRRGPSDTSNSEATLVES